MSYLRGSVGEGIPSFSGARRSLNLFARKGSGFVVITRLNTIEIWVCLDRLKAASTTTQLQGVAPEVMSKITLKLKRPNATVVDTPGACNPSSRFQFIEGH